MGAQATARRPEEEWARNDKKLPYKITRSQDWQSQPFFPSNLAALSSTSNTASITGVGNTPPLPDELAPDPAGSGPARPPTLSILNKNLDFELFRPPAWQNEGGVLRHLSCLKERNPFKWKKQFGWNQGVLFLKGRLFVQRPIVVNRQRGGGVFTPKSWN